MCMAMQRLFARVVDHFLPSAIPTTLERHEDFTLGAVLHYKTKPKPFMPWRKNELHFSDCTLNELLVEGQQLKFAAMRNFLFDAKSGINIPLDASPEFHRSLEQLKVNTAGVKQFYVATDLGRVNHVVSDIFTLILAQKVRLNTSHPVVKVAMRKGSIVFVISTLYQTEHLRMKVIAGGAPVANAPVIEFNGTTTIAYLLLGLRIDSDGTLKPKLNTGSLKVWSPPVQPLLDIEKSPLSTKKRVGTANKDEAESEEEGDSCSTPLISVKTTVEDDWVNIKCKVMESPPHAAAKGASPSQASGGPPCSIASPPHSDDYLTGSIQSRLSSTEIDTLFLHSLRDFDQFRSRTYDGVVQEARHWVDPLRSREGLRVAFIEYTAPHLTYQRLEKLSHYLREVSECLRKREAYPPNTNPDFTPVLDKLSQSWSHKLEQVTAMLYAAEACMDFPQHTLRKAFALKSSKKAQIIELIRHTPYGTDQHVYTDAGPFRDPDIYPILNKVGFSLSDTKLMFVAPDDAETEDILVATIIVMYISSPKTVY